MNAATDIFEAQEYLTARELQADGLSKDNVRAQVKGEYPHVTDDRLEAVIEGAFHDARAKTSPGNGKNGGRPRTPYWALVEIYLKAIQNKYHVRFWRGKWFRREASGGAYRETSEDSVRGEIMAELKARTEWRKHATRHAVSEIVAQLQAPDVCGIDETTERPAWLVRDNTRRLCGIPAPNTMCLRDTVHNVYEEAQHLSKQAKNPRKGIPADEDFWSLDYVPYAFSREYTGHMPLFRKFLDETLDPDEQFALQEMFGVCLTDTTDFESFWMLYGRSGREGKNVVLEILEALVGRHNISRVELQALCERFQTWPLTESKVNVAGDMPNFGHGALSKIEGFLKHVTGHGAAIDVERKNQPKRLNVPVRAKFAFATNHLPHFADKSDGIWRRLRIIDFPRQVPIENVDVNLAEKIIKSEMSAVFAWALEGLAEVIARGHVRDTDKGANMKAQHRVDCDHERQFLLDEGLERGTEQDRISAKEMYGRYTAWINDNGYRALGTSKFYARLSELLGTRHGSARVNGTATKCIIGIRETIDVTDVTAEN